MAAGYNFTVRCKHITQRFKGKHIINIRMRHVKLLILRVIAGYASTRQPSDENLKMNLKMITIARQGLARISPTSVLAGSPNECTA